jgi:hypothetical protein
MISAARYPPAVICHKPPTSRLPVPGICDSTSLWICWHGIWPGGFCSDWPKAAGMRPVSCGLRGPSPAPMPRSRASPGRDAWDRSPDVILGFAEYALCFPVYICLSFSLSLLFRQSLWYDSQFNISIRTRLISTGWDV